MALNTIADLSTTSASNTDVLGQSTAGSAAANTIDTIVQNTLALMARAYADVGGIGTVGGSANAITLTSASTYQALEAGLLVAIKAGSENTAATTLNVDGLGVKAVRLNGDVALAGGEIVANGVYLFRYDTAFNSSAGAWVLMNPSSVPRMTAPAADRILFFDYSALAYAYLSLGAGLTISGTTLKALRTPGGTTSSATPTPAADDYEQYNLTALAEAATFGAPTGTPADTQKLIIRIKDNGTARALSWNSVYRSCGATLPTTTVISKTTYVGLIYNSAATKWDCVAVTTEA